jgi:hypothetical protein
VWNLPESFNVINHWDYEDIKRVFDKEVTLPIEIDDIPGKGKGLRASRNISKY